MFHKNCPYLSHLLQAIRMQRFGCCILALAVMLPAHAESIFVTLEKGNSVVEVDGATGEVRRTVQVGKRPRGILTTRDGRKIFVATSEDNSIVVLDPRTLEVLGRVPVDKDPKTFALDPLETRLFASNDDDNQLTVVDVESRQILKRIPI